ncbi:interferon lambda receptor 1 [Phyllostomus discolor]|uniref:Interferon lambda receptor 1 n=1 Tax=Phyllostomus discolor TaxID=89673 RepID=A0A834AGI1_9CHIR|nr:interferon lambda receptor 1 [Phyllostomus discolor]
MSPAGRWALLLLCLLKSARGRPHLAPPQNVTLMSRNFSVYLTWLPGPGNPQNVTYLVAYQSFATTPRRWRKVEKCAGTKELTCSLMCLEKQDLFNKFKGRVRVVSPSAKSVWVESKYLEYLFEVEPAPPILVVTLTEGVLKVNATYQLPHCMPLSNLMYEVDFWKEEAENKTRLAATRHGREAQIPLQLATSGNHCVSARTIYICDDPKYSEFSKPTCFSLGTPGVGWVSLVLLPLLLVLPTGCVIWKSWVTWKSFAGDPWFQRAETPQALEPTRRIRLISRIRAPAAVQAGPEEDRAEEEDDEEDTDDDVSFRPYIAPPPFLERERRTPGQPEEGVQVEGCPAWDSSDRSWASTVGSCPSDGAGSSGYLVKKGLGQVLGEDRCQDPLLLPKFSKDLGSLKELQRDDPSSWAGWGSSSPRLKLAPGEPLVSFQTLTFGWDSGTEDGEEEEEEEGGSESELGDSSAGSWGTDSLQRTEARSVTLGHYMAR